MNRMARTLATSAGLALALLLLSQADAQAFCGFYVAKADTKLFNKASQVVLVRDGDRTVVTMSNDFQGDPKEFAMVIPVPTFVERGQIHVGDRAVIEHLDSSSTRISWKLICPSALAASNSSALQISTRP